MLGDVSPQTIRLTAQAVVYPGRDHVVRVTIEKASGRRYVRADITAVTRAVLVFLGTDPVIAYDSLVDPVFTFGSGGVLEIDLSDYAMPASILSSHLILFDAEHPNGQAIADDTDVELVFDFRNVSTTGTTPPPSVEYVTEAPLDGGLYGRQDGGWVSINDVVAGVASVNGQTGFVTLDAADVGADPAGEGAAQVALHEAALDPHPQYTTAAEAAAAAPVQTVNGQTGAVTLDAADVGADPTGTAAGAVTAHVVAADPHPQYLTETEGDARYERGLVAGTNITIDRTNPAAPVINATGGGGGGSGTVTSVGLSAPTGFDVSGSPVTASGTLALAFATGYSLPTNANQANWSTAFGWGDHAAAGYEKQLTAGANITIDRTDPDNPIISSTASGGGSGEANTASNLGAGDGLFAQKVGVDLQFKSLVAGAGVTLTPSANSIEIVASGAGGAVDSVNGQTGAVVLDTNDIDEGATNLYFTNARASAAAPVQTVDGQTGAVSLSASYAPLSHVGDTGAAHGNASTSVAGFMSGADKTKLDGITAGANNYVHPNHTGDVTSVGDGAQTIVNNAVTNTKMADMATQTIKGRTTAGTGDPEDLTAAQVRTVLNVADGATANPNTDAVAEGATNLYHTAARVLATALSGLSLATGSAITSADTVLVAFGKLQKQITDLIAAVGGKQDTLVSGTNIKTINGNSLLGSGNIAISGGGSANWGGIGGALADQTDLQAALDAKTNIAGIPVRVVTASGAITPADAGYMIISTSATPITLTIGAEATAAWTVSGLAPTVHFLQDGAGAVTITGDGFSVTTHASDTNVLDGQIAAATVVWRGTNSWRLFGRLVAA